MSSDVNREAVFQAIKVRTHLKQDGSWINRFQDVQNTQPDVKPCKPVKLVKPKNVSSPESCSVSSSNLDSSTPPQSSNVMSALKKLEPLNSTENIPVKSGSNLAKSAHPVLGDSKKAHVEKAVETSTVKATELPLKTSADASVKDRVEKPIDKPIEEPLKMHADTPNTDVVKKPTEEPLKLHADTPKLDVVEKPVVKPAEVPLKTHANTPKRDIVEKPVEEPSKTHEDTTKRDEVEKPVEEPLKMHGDTPKQDIVEKPVEEPLKMHADTLIKDIVEKAVEEALKVHAYTPKMYAVDNIVKPVEEPLKIPTDVPVKTIVEKPVEEPLEMHADTPKQDVVEKPVEEPLKTPTDVPVKTTVEKPVQEALKVHVVDNIVIPVEEPLKTPTDVPVKTTVEKPVEEALKVHAVDNIVIPVEEPLKTPTDVPVKTTVEKPVEESLKTHTESPVEGTGKTPVDGASTDQTLSSGVLQEKTVKTLHENPAKPSGTLTTENKEDDTAEQVSIANAAIVEAPLEQAENQPANKHGELSLVSALETPTAESSTTSPTEPTKEPHVAALEENHRLNSQAELNVKSKTMCSFCKLPVDGNVKISVNIPAICCHPDCFKCNGCSSPLGDLSSSMYHCAGKILCEKCFDQIFQL